MHILVFFWFMFTWICFAETSTSASTPNDDLKQVEKIDETSKSDEDKEGPFSSQSTETSAGN